MEPSVATLKYGRMESYELIYQHYIGKEQYETKIEII